MPTSDTLVKNPIVNVLTTSQYNAITPNDNEFYLITDDAGGAYAGVEMLDITLPANG